MIINIIIYICINFNINVVSIEINMNIDIHFDIIININIKINITIIVNSNINNKIKITTGIVLGQVITLYQLFLVCNQLGKNLQTKLKSMHTCIWMIRGKRKISVEKEIELSIYYNQLHPFESVYKPEEMNCLALIGHNNMKP